MKYMPSVFLRKRNNGDTQATMGTRVWGVSSSARSLIFADGVPLTALVANNNTIGGPRWGLVSPDRDRAHRRDVRAVLRGVLRELDGRCHGDHDASAERLEGAISQTQAMQRFNLYGTKANVRNDANQRGRRRSVRQALVLGERELSGQSQPAPRVRHERNVSHRYRRRVLRAEQAWSVGERARRERVAPYENAQRESEGGLRLHAAGCARRTPSAIGRTTRRLASTPTSTSRACRHSPDNPPSRRASTTSTRRTRRTASRFARTRSAIGISRRWERSIASAKISSARHSPPRRPIRRSAPRGASRCSTVLAGRHSTSRARGIRGGRKRRTS